MELSDEAKAEIAAAVKILREDGVHIHKSYASFQKSLEDKIDPKNPPDSTDDDTEGNPPPAKSDSDTTPPEKAGLWWGKAK